jgi:hypothetical protein
VKDTHQTLPAFSTARLQTASDRPSLPQLYLALTLDRPD